MHLCMHIYMYKYPCVYMYLPEIFSCVRQSCDIIHILHNRLQEKALILFLNIAMRRQEERKAASLLSFRKNAFNLWGQIKILGRV